MDDIYDDLENFNDVNVVNELKAENEELKQKLAQYAESMSSLQKDFDNLSVELKKLETNYSSLLKSARTEIKRKTDMIKNLNIEKDMLVLKQFQDKPDHRRKLMNAYRVKAEGNAKKKNNPNKAEDLKQREEFRKSPSENSSTGTEKSNKSTDNKVGESGKSISRNISKENETHQNEAFPNHRENYHDDRFQGGGITDRRISTITSQQFLKFSSDEEFEDMYSALEPKPSKGTSFGDEPQRVGQTRVRDEPRHARVYHESSGPQDKRTNYNDTPRERFNKNRNRRFYDNERNVNRDKHDEPHLIRNKYSPDRARFGKRDFGDDRLLQQYDRHRWVENSVGERYQHRRRERRPYPDRNRNDQNPDMDRNNYSDTYTIKNKVAGLTQIHGEYDQPPLKRFRGDQYAHDEGRRNDRQVPHEQHPYELREAYQQPQNNDELVSSIYADLDKPIISDSGMPPGDSNIIKGNQDVNRDMEIQRDFVSKHDPESTKKDNVKDNLRSTHTEDKLHEAEKNYKISKYKIPLKGHKVNTDEISENKINKVGTVLLSGENKSSGLPQKDLPTVKDHIKILDVPKTAESSKLSSNANSESIPAKNLKTDKNEAEVNTSFERALQQKLSSIRNIVEGDLELSDETNDDTQVQLKENEPTDTKKKHKIKKKSHKDNSKDKTPTRKTRSKTDKDKDAKARNKFSELFGDSSSLLAPEDMELAPRLESTQIADSYTAVCEDALDGIPLQVKQNNIRTLGAKKEISGPDLNEICLQSDSLHLKEKIKANKGRANHNKLKKSEVLSTVDDKKPSDVNLSVVVNSPTANSGKTTLHSEVAKSESSEKTKEQHARNKSAKEIKNDNLETALVSEVKVAASHKKDTAQEKIIKCDNIATLLMPEATTTVITGNPKEIDVKRPTQIVKSNIVETHTKQKVKTIASSEKCTEILNISKPETSIVETHLMPDVKASFEKCKEISNAPTPGGKTESDAVKTDFIPEVKKMASTENTEKVFDVTRPPKKIKSNAVVTPVLSEVGVEASNETSKKLINKSKLDSKKDLETHLTIEEKPAEKSKETQNSTKSEKKTKGDALKCNDKTKNTKSNKKSKEGKMFPSGEVEKGSNIIENHIMAELNNPPLLNSNKENQLCEEASKETMNSDLPKIFEDTLVPIENISVDKNTTDEEKLAVIMEPKEALGNTRIDDIPNLEAVTDDHGLVNTVVISSGIQPADVNVLQNNTTENQYTPLKALATSTPTREVSSTFNTSSQIQPFTNTLTSSVNIKTGNEDAGSKNDESDIPDVRIYCYRRRRKLVR